MLESIFTAIKGVVTGMLDVLSSLFEGIVDIFYVAGESGAAGEPTFLGYVLLIGVGTPIVFWGINWIVSLFRRMLKK